MPGLSHSFLVSGWLEAPLVCDLDIAFAPSALGIACAATDSAPHTLAFSFQTMPAISQPNLVKGCRERSPEFAIQTFAFSSQAISALLQSTRVNGWVEKSSA